MAEAWAMGWSVRDAYGGCLKNVFRRRAVEKTGLQKKVHTKWEATSWSCWRHVCFQRSRYHFGPPQEVQYIGLYSEVSPLWKVPNVLGGCRCPFLTSLDPKPTGFRVQSSVLRRAWGCRFLFFLIPTESARPEMDNCA